MGKICCTDWLVSHNNLSKVFIGMDWELFNSWTLHFCCVFTFSCGALKEIIVNMPFWTKYTEKLLILCSFLGTFTSDWKSHRKVQSIVVMQCLWCKTTNVHLHFQAVPSAILSVSKFLIFMVSLINSFQDISIETTWRWSSFQRVWEHIDIAGFDTTERSLNFCDGNNFSSSVIIVKNWKPKFGCQGSAIQKWLSLL